MTRAQFIALLSAAALCAATRAQVVRSSPNSALTNSLSVARESPRVAESGVKNVRDYGAKCDGSTRDTRAFQSAATDVPTVGGIILIPAGVNCVISGTITLSAGTTVLGYGASITSAAASFWPGGAIQSVFKATIGSNFEIAGLIFRYPHADFGSGPAHIIELEAVSHVRIHDNFFDGGGDAVANIGSTDVWVINNSHTNATSGCYDNWGGFTEAHVNFNYCTVMPTVLYGSDGISFTGINTDGSEATSIGFEAIGNTIVMSNNNAPAGIVINGHASAKGKDDEGRISNNRIIATPGVSTWGILDNGYASNNDIHDNYCEGSGGSYSCVAVQAPAVNVKVHDNIAYNWQAGAWGDFANSAVGGTLAFNEAYFSSSPLIGATDISTQVFGNDVGTGKITTPNALSAGAVTAKAITVNAGVAETSEISIGQDAGPAAYQYLNRAAGYLGGTIIQSGGLARWWEGVSNTAESGSNVGSDWLLDAYSDDGRFLSQPILVKRSTGLTTLTSLSVMGDTTLSGLSTGSNADYLCLSSSGALLIQASSCTLSSVRFNDSVEKFKGSALSKISKMEVASYRVKDKSNRDPNTTARQTGLLAENIAEVAPECAIYEDDLKTPKSFREECVIALLVKALQEQALEIAHLKQGVR